MARQMAICSLNKKISRLAAWHADRQREHLGLHRVAPAQCSGKPMRKD